MGYRRSIGSHDLGMRSWLGMITIIKKLFKLLFTRPLTNDLYGNSVISLTWGFNFKAGQSDHVFRKVSDPDRLAHIQEEHVAPFGQGSSLNNKLCGLRY